MKNVLITGGAGFVGSHLCEKLAGRGCTVTSLDNYFTGSVENHVPGVEYINGSTNQINSILRNRLFDTVYHLGEYSRVEQSFEDIDLVWEYNKLGTYEVLKFARNTGSKLIYSGSSTKFTDKTPGYIQSPYAWSKASNTELVMQYAEWYDMEYAITYFYNVYGPREIADGKYATLIAKYKTLMKSSADLPVVLPGTQHRNFTHIDDIIDALLLIGEMGYGDEFGIGSPTSYSIREVADMFGGKILELPMRRGNRMSAPVLTKKTRALGWEPKQELAKYIHELKQNGWKE